MDWTIMFIVLGSSIWVLFDAYAIGAKKGQLTGITNNGPWGWFFGCLLLWIVILPCYLANREDIKRLSGK